MLNIPATLRFNIQAFGWAKGLRLPVLIYGKIKIKSIGNIRLHCKVRRRLIVIGANYETVVAPYTMFCNTGSVEVYGRVYINYGTTFINQGTVVFRGSNLIGNKSDVYIHQLLDIGYNCSFGFETHISDTDHHFVVDVNTHRVTRNTLPIIIGNFNWYGSCCFIKKGTITPDYLIVASPYSMLSKDYSSLPPYTVLAGCPAKPLKQGIQRIYNFAEERKIIDYFQQNPEAVFYQYAADVDLDETCKL